MTSDTNITEQQNPVLPTSISETDIQGSEKASSKQIYLPEQPKAR
jgi:hypothetical protein